MGASIQLDRNKKTVMSLALLGIAFTTLSMGAVTPAIASVGEAFPQVPVLYLSMLSTLPSLISMPVTLIAGWLAGRGTSYRAIVLTGLACMSVSGIAPYFSQSFYGILFWRAVFGGGMGAVTPILMPLVLVLFKDEEAHVQSSSNAVATNAGCVVFQMLGGMLCGAAGWRYTFLIYLLLIPCFFLVFLCLPEPKHSPHPQTRTSGSASCRNAFGWWVLYALECILFYPVITETSSIVLAEGYGDAGSAAIVLSMFTVGGVLGGYLYRRLRHLKHRVLTVIFMLMAAGSAGMMGSIGIFTMTAGATCIGIGFGMFLPAIQMLVGFSVAPEARPKASSWLTVFSSAGSFSSAFLIAGAAQLTGYHPGRFSFAVSTVGFSVLSIWFLFRKTPTNTSLVNRVLF